MEFDAACLAGSQKHFETVWSRIRCIPHRDGGILPSEMLAFISTVLEQGVNVVVESGRKNGFSTETLAACTDLGFELISIEREPILSVDRYLKEKYPNRVSLCRGNGRWLVPYYVRRAAKKGNRVATLLDGPKGLKALKLFDKVGWRCTHGAMHDASRRRWSEGIVEPNPIRQVLESRPCWFTDDPAFRQMTSALDQNVERPHFANTPETYDCAFTLAMLPGGRWRPAAESKAA